MSRRAWLVGLTCGVCLLMAVATLPRVPLLMRCAQYSRPHPLRMPVAGLNPREARSSWHAPRSGGRRHEGIDLFAKKGTPVVSATRGEIWRIGVDPLGGNVVTVLGDGPALYYYAHLDDWDDGLYIGRRVEKGTPLGFVGNTGNARTTPSHLHFGIYKVGWRRSPAVDPAPLLGVPR